MLRYAFALVSALALSTVAFAHPHAAAAYNHAGFRAGFADRAFVGVPAAAYGYANPALALPACGTAGVAACPAPAATAYGVPYGLQARLAALEAQLAAPLPAAPVEELPAPAEVDAPGLLLGQNTVYGSELGLAAGNFATYGSYGNGLGFVGHRFGRAFGGRFGGVAHLGRGLGRGVGRGVAYVGRGLGRAGRGVAHAGRGVAHAGRSVARGGRSGGRRK